MVDAIVNEIAIRRNYLSNNEIKTVYFGGGTPSIMESHHFTKIFNKLHEIYIIDLVSRDLYQVTVSQEEDYPANWIDPDREEDTEGE